MGDTKTKNKPRKHWSDLSGWQRFRLKAWERIAYDWNPVFRYLQAKRYRRLMEGVKKRE